KYSKDIVLQKIETTATIVTKAIKITDDSAILVFLGENVVSYNEKMNNLDRTILKLPLEVNNSWKSSDYSFNIMSYDQKNITVSQEFDGGKIETTYEVDLGMSNEVFYSEGFEKHSKLIEKELDI
ncbi:MAG: hypothetical protein ACRC0G_00895, partial [Fusobacteriaceae bacterium]